MCTHMALELFATFFVTKCSRVKKKKKRKTFSNINKLLKPIVSIPFADRCNSVKPPGECTDLPVEPLGYTKQIEM